MGLAIKKCGSSRQAVPCGLAACFSGFATSLMLKLVKNYLNHQAMQARKKSDYTSEWVIFAVGIQKFITRKLLVIYCMQIKVHVAVVIWFII